MTLKQIPCPCVLTGQLAYFFTVAAISLGTITVKQSDRFYFKCIVFTIPLFHSESHDVHPLSRSTSLGAAIQRAVPFFGR